MRIEARLGRTLPILLLAPPRKRNEGGMLRPGALAHLACRFTSVQPRHPQVERGRKVCCREFRSIVKDVANDLDQACFIAIDTDRFVGKF